MLSENEEREEKVKNRRWERIGCLKGEGEKRFRRMGVRE